MPIYNEENMQREYEKNKKKAGVFLNNSQKTEEQLNKGTVLLNQLNGKNEKISNIATDIFLMFELVGSWVKGNYREIPYTSLVAIFGAIVYLVSPIDAIPDFIPIAGFTDDASVLAVALKAVGTDLDKFKRWKQRAY